MDVRLNVTTVARVVVANPVETVTKPVVVPTGGRAVILVALLAVTVRRVVPT
jgi:hypothetical protein